MVTDIYIIIVTPQDSLFQLVDLLDKNKVEVVSSKDLISVARQRSTLMRE